MPTAGAMLSRAASSFVSDFNEDILTVKFKAAISRLTSDCDCVRVVYNVPHKNAVEFTNDKQFVNADFYLNVTANIYFFR